MRGADPTHYLWWLGTRASGVVALGLVTVSVTIGLAMASGALRRPGLKRRLLAVHEHAALAGLVAIGVHALCLLGDPWLHPGVKGLTVPFAMSYRPLYTGLGIIAAYLAGLLGLSFYARRRIGPKLWRRTHRATIAVYVLGVIHMLGAGTDAGSAWLRWGLLVSSLPLAYFLVLRLAPRGKPPVAARRPVARSEAVTR